MQTRKQVSPHRPPPPTLGLCPSSRFPSSPSSAALRRRSSSSAALASRLRCSCSAASPAASVPTWSGAGARQSGGRSFPLLRPLRVCPVAQARTRPHSAREPKAAGSGWQARAATRAHERSPWLPLALLSPGPALPPTHPTRAPTRPPTKSRAAPPPAPTHSPAPLCPHCPLTRPHPPAPACTRRTKACPHLPRAVRVLDGGVAARVAPSAVVPPGPPHGGVVVDRHVLIVPRPRLDLLPLDQPPCSRPVVGGGAGAGRDFGRMVFGFSEYYFGFSALLRARPLKERC